MALKFELTKKEAEAARKWIDEHECPAVKSGCTGPLMERVRFVFIPTLVGTIGGIECACDAGHLLTDVREI
ncbi:MAG TPA: hypothetical protein GX528_09940 [Firmicutes bacterium]|nr:hypothetical protein [Bacillota bacterium]